MAMEPLTEDQRCRLARAMEEWRRIMVARRGTRDLVDDLIDALNRQSFELSDVSNG